MTSPQSGKDGDYRMKVDETYETLAKMAKAAKILYKVYLVFVLAKLLWLATPQLVPQHRMDPLQFGVFAVGFGGGVIAWSKAAVGSRFEHFGAVMLFNILTALGVGFHMVSRARDYYIPMGRGPSQSEVAALALAQVFPALKDSSEDAQQVGIPLFYCLHSYIMQKKLARKGLKTKKKSQ